MLVDTHCHLDFNSFDEDRAQVIQRARENHITRILNPGIDLSSSQAAASLATQFEEVYAGVGVHPNESSTWQTDTSIRLNELAASPKVAAIGEIGLDYYRDEAPKRIQHRAFLAQLDLAGELGLPVVIHNRDATDDVLKILNDWVAGLKRSHSSLAARPGVLHSYSGNRQQADMAIDLNFYLGITGPITFRSALELQAVVADLSLDRLLIETDAPFLTPSPNRGKRNEPAYVRYVAEKIAELKQLDYDELSTIVTTNARKLFQW